MPFIRPSEGEKGVKEGWGGGGRYNGSKKDFVKGLVEVLYFLLLDWETKLSEYWHFAYTQFNISNL